MSKISPVVIVNNLIKRYKTGQQNAVDDISFRVFPGEFFTLLGPNGAGKTTTISILSTILAKTAGTVQIGGFDVDAQASHVRQILGIIFQNPSLDKNLTAEENIRFHCALYGLFPFRPSYRLMPQSYKTKVSELGQLLGLTNDMFNPIKTYSGGMKRKLEIIRSIMHNPKVLFLDEPTSGLDPESRSNLWEYLLQVKRREKMTIFLTTHYLGEAEESDRVCVINYGKIVAMGTPSEIKKELVDEFIILDAKNRTRLKKEILALRQPFTETGHFKLMLDTITAQEAIHRIQTKLSLLEIHTPTLEQAYLEIVREKNGHSK